MVWGARRRMNFRVLLRVASRAFAKPAFSWNDFTTLDRELRRDRSGPSVFERSAARAGRRRADRTRRPR